MWQKEATAQSVIAEMPRPLITGRGLVAMAGFYLLFALFYAITINWEANDQFFEPYPSLLGRVFFDYALKAAWTLPVWYIIIYKMDQVSWNYKLLAHLILGVLWLVGWFWSYYSLLPLIGSSGLTGSARKWDVYIPTLFYVLQFGVLHTVRYTEQIKYRNRIQQELLAMAHQSKITSLKAQINPHFLFNTLNTISASVPPELEDTRTLIMKLADVFRFTLDASRQETVPLREELHFLQAYLDLEKERLGERLQVYYTLEEQLMDIPVPPMLLQPLVENAIRHGIAPSLQGGSIHIEVKQESNKQMRITIADTGLGNINGHPLASGTKGVGLKNTHERLLKHYGTGLAINDQWKQGFEISFYVPLTKAIDESHYNGR